MRMGNTHYDYNYYYFFYYNCYYYCSNAKSKMSKQLCHAKRISHTLSRGEAATYGSQRTKYVAWAELKLSCLRLVMRPIQPRH